MSTIKIPPVLRGSTGGEKEVSAEGASVGDVLRSLVEQHPDCKTQLFDEDVRVLDGLDTEVKPIDTLVILPAMAGG